MCVCVCVCWVVMPPPANEQRRVRVSCYRCGATRHVQVGHVLCSMHAIMCVCMRVRVCVCVCASVRGTSRWGTPGARAGETLLPGWGSVFVSRTAPLPLYQCASVFVSHAVPLPLHQCVSVCISVISVFVSHTAPPPLPRTPGTTPLVCAGVCC